MEVVRDSVMKAAREQAQPPNRREKYRTHQSAERVQLIERRVQLFAEGKWLQIRLLGADTDHQLLTRTIKVI